MVSILSVRLMQWRYKVQARKEGFENDHMTFERTHRVVTGTLRR